MKGTYTQYRPAYIDGYENEIGSFESTEQLLAIPFIAHWKNPQDFHRYSISHTDRPNLEKYSILMGEFKGGAEWWVIAFLRNVEGECDLPEWDSEEAAHLRHEWAINHSKGATS